MHRLLKVLATTIAKTTSQGFLKIVFVLFRKIASIHVFFEVAVVKIRIELAPSCRLFELEVPLCSSSLTKPPIARHLFLALKISWLRRLFLPDFGNKPGVDHVEGHLESPLA